MEERSHRHSNDSSVTDVLVDSLLSALTSTATETSAGEAATGGVFPTVTEWPHSPGERLLPRVRVDLTAQRIEDDIKAVDVRGEIGYQALAGQLRYTRMWEGGAEESLMATYLHVLLRLQLDKNVEVDLGLGGLNLDGKGSNTGISATIPFQIHGKNLGLEFRPAWSSLNGNVIEDYDVAVVAGMQYIALRAGYRWLIADQDSLHGPYAGISLSW